MKQGELERGSLARARAGDPLAFRALYDHHADAVFRFLWRMLRDDAAAEDALQEVFLKVFGALGRFDETGPARLSTWIFTIARRVALNLLERTKTRSDASAPLPPTAAPGVAPDLRLALEAAIAALPAGMRSTFVLRECCDLSYDEVAVIEAVDVGTVKSRLHRARALLQASLRGHEEEPERSRDELRASR
jgi:RNA polymerase sigma-70 factor, ECF subfamily